MAFVLDASVTMAWCFEDEASVYCDRVLDLLAQETALAPVVWPLEIANVLLVAERRGRLRTEEVFSLAQWLCTLRIAVDNVDLRWVLSVVMNLARAHGLTSYDAAYLELAMRRKLPLATEDNRLRAAAVASGVALVP
jgi:predicted nucleic acid-binding protein